MTFITFLLELTHKEHQTLILKHCFFPGLSCLSLSFSPTNPFSHSHTHTHTPKHTHTHTHTNTHTGTQVHKHIFLCQVMSGRTKIHAWETELPRWRILNVTQANQNSFDCCGFDLFLAFWSFRDIWITSGHLDSVFFQSLKCYFLLAKLALMLWREALLSRILRKWRVQSLENSNI